MKLGCLISSVSRRAGGIHESVRRLAQSLDGSRSTRVHVLGMLDEHTQKDKASWGPLPVHVFRAHGPCQFGYAPRLKQRLFELDVDVLLTNGLWMYPTVAALAWHRRTHRPFIVAPHGMLDPWAINHSGFKKRVAGYLYENSSLRRAACIRALCESEASSIRAYGLRNPICVIPNGIDLPDPKAVHEAPWKEHYPRKNILLYLGRLHPKKNLAPLLRAWAAVQRESKRAEEWKLVIAGWDQNGYETELRRLVSYLCLLDSVLFIGPQFGQAKAAAYHRADAFVLPSLSEGLPMVALEAWANQLPVLITPECNLPEGFEARAAIHIDPATNSIAQGLKALFSMEHSERKQMGSRGQKLVGERFSWPKIGDQMHDVCQWILGQGAQPACVLTENNHQQTHTHRQIIEHSLA